jgi:hypothetical protein
MSYDMMNLAPLLYVGKVMEQSFLLLIYMLLLVIPAISVISVIYAILAIGYVDLPIILLFL